MAKAPSSFTDHQFLIVPLLNPDGVARGHWRANRGAVDLNRDWGAFTQPETRAVKAWLDALPPTVRPVAMIDFHSTSRNLFYVQGDDEASAAQQRFRSVWLAGREDALPGDPFTIEPRNANPGSGTAKNWFHATYAIPAYTYEVADTADRDAARAAAQRLAANLPAALAALED
jgi:predicted deacylase